MLVHEKYPMSVGMTIKWKIDCHCVTKGKTYTSFGPAVPSSSQSPEDPVCTGTATYVRWPAVVCLTLVVASISC